MATEPWGTIMPVRPARRRSRMTCSAAGRMDRTRAMPSTWPCTRWPSSSCPSRSGAFQIDCAPREAGPAWSSRGSRPPRRTRRPGRPVRGGQADAVDGDAVAHGQALGARGPSSISRASAGRAVSRTVRIGPICCTMPVNIYAAMLGDERPAAITFGRGRMQAHPARKPLRYPAVYRVFIAFRRRRQKTWVMLANSAGRPAAEHGVGAAGQGGRGPPRAGGAAGRRARAAGGRAGRGQDLLARALARSIDCTFSRIQLTPDLLPSDILGVSVYDSDERASSSSSAGPSSPTSSWPTRSTAPRRARRAPCWRR